MDSLDNDNKENKSFLDKYFADICVSIIGFGSAASLLYFALTRSNNAVDFIQSRFGVNIQDLNLSQEQFDLCQRYTDKQVKTIIIAASIVATILVVATIGVLIAMNTGKEMEFKDASGVNDVNNAVNNSAI